MTHCPECWQKEQEITLITNDETGEAICPKCGFVGADSEKKTESKFQEKDDFRGTDEETGESKSQHAPKDVGDYGGTSIGKKDVSGRPIGGEYWNRQRILNNQILTPFEKMVKAHKPKFKELTKRIMQEAFQTSPIYKGDITDEERLAYYQGVLDNDNADGGGYWDFQTDYKETSSGTRWVDALSTTSGAVNYADGVWHNVVITKSGNTSSDVCKFYADGSLITSFTLTNSGGKSWGFNSLTFGSGWHYNKWNWWSKAMKTDDYRIYNAALSADQVSELFEMGGTV